MDVLRSSTWAVVAQTCFTRRKVSGIIKIVEAEWLVDFGTLRMLRRSLPTCVHMLYDDESRTDARRSGPLV